jgi:type II secretory pathway pseudopilin PulG
VLSRRRKSFTLLELMIAFVIMAILSAVAIPSLINIASNDRTTADQTSAISLADASYYGAVSADSSGSGDVSVNYCDGADQATALPLSSTGLFSISESSAVQVTSACTVSPGYSGTVYYQFGDPVIIAVTVPGTDGGPLPSVDASDSTTTSSSTTSTTSTTTTTVPSPILATISVPNPQAVCTDGTDAWVADYVDNTVNEVNISSSAIVNTVAVGNDPNAIACYGGNVWVTNRDDDTVSEINAASAAVTTTFTLSPYGGDPAGVYVDATGVWVTVGVGYGTVQLDPTTGAQLNFFATGDDGSNGSQGIVGNGTDVWVSNGNTSTVVEIDEATATMGTPWSVGPAYGDINIALSGSDIWATDYFNGTVAEYTTDGTLVQSVSSTNPYSVAVSSNDVWVANQFPDQLTEINATTAATDQTVSLDGEPEDVFADSSFVWATTFSTDDLLQLTP